MLSKQEELILFILVRKGADVPAAVVQAELSDASKREESFGAIFTTLDRMCDKKLVRYRKGQPDARRGGRAPRLYEITASGRKALDYNNQVTQAAAGLSNGKGALGHA